MQRVLDDGAEASERARSIARLEVLFLGLWRRPDGAAIEPLTECAAFFHSQGDAHRSQGPERHRSASPAQESTRLRGRGRYLQQAFEVAASLADPFGRAIVGLLIGRAYLMRGDVPKAIETLDASLSAGRSVGDRLLVGFALGALGWGAIITGDLNPADKYFREELLIASTIGHEPGVGYALEGLFATSATRGDVERAGQLLGAAEAIRQRKGNAAARPLLSRPSFSRSNRLPTRRSSRMRGRRSCPRSSGCRRTRPQLGQTEGFRQLILGNDQLLFAQPTHDVRRRRVGGLQGEGEVGAVDPVELGAGDVCVGVLGTGRGHHLVRAGVHNQRWTGDAIQRCRE